MTTSTDTKLFKAIHDVATFKTQHAKASSNTRVVRTKPNTISIYLFDNKIAEFEFFSIANNCLHIYSLGPLWHSVTTFRRINALLGRYKGGCTGLGKRKGVSYLYTGIDASPSREWRESDHYSYSITASL